MHEVSLVHSLFDQADQSLGPYTSERVRLVRVHIGDRSGVEADLFASAFAGVRAERGYGAAELEMVTEPGNALVLERIELEVPDV